LIPHCFFPVGISALEPPIRMFACRCVFFLSACPRTDPRRHGLTCQLWKSLTVMFSSLTYPVVLYTGPFLKLFVRNLHFAALPFAPMAFRGRPEPGWCPGVFFIPCSFLSDLVFRPTVIPPFEELWIAPLLQTLLDVFCSSSLRIKFPFSTPCIFSLPTSPLLSQIFPP